MKKIIKIFPAIAFLIILGGKLLYEIYCEDGIRDNYNFAILSDDLRQFWVSCNDMKYNTQKTGIEYKIIKNFLKKYPNTIGFKKLSQIDETNNLFIIVFPSPQYPYMGLLTCSGFHEVVKIGGKGYYDFWKVLIQKIYSFNNIDESTHKTHDIKKHQLQILTHQQLLESLDE